MRDALWRVTSGWWGSNMKLRLVRWVPRSVLYWCVIQAWVLASAEYPHKHVDNISWDMVCKFLAKGKTE